LEVDVQQGNFKMFNKVTLRSYCYFLKFLYFFGYRNGFLQVGQKLQKLVKKTEGILGVKLKFGGGNLFSPAMTSIIEGNNSMGSLSKPLLKKVTPVVGSRML
jgi:hypothetical protein